MAVKKVAIIGCGVGGLTAIKCCLDAGLQPTCFEQQSKFGGIWNYTDGPRPNLGSVHASTITNVSKATICYSDYPMPKEWPNYMHHSMFMKYLEMYAKEFELERYVKLNTTVERLSKAADHETTGRWLVSYTRKSEDGKVTEENHKGETIEETFDAVMICVGHLCYPATPKFPGMEDFKGVQVHSGNYRSFHPFVGKRVVVVGSSYSAGDISIELSLHASQVYLSTRQGSYVVKRLVPGSTKPFDHQITRQESFVNKYFNRSLFKGVLNTEYDFVRLGLQPTGVAMVQQFPFFEELPTRIMSGRVIVKGALKELRGSSVVFDGEDVVDNIDAIVYATGFDLKFPFASDLIEVENGHYTRLYKHIFIPDADQQTLAVIGLMETIGAHPPIWEIQARVACEVFAGRCVLPSKADRVAECVAEEEYLTKIGRPKEKFLYGVMNIPYMDEVSALIGAKPNLWSIFLRDPKLAYCCFYGPGIGAQYRLQGPNTWKGAKNVIKSVEEDYQYPLKVKRCEPMMAKKESSYLFWVLVVVFGALLAYFLRYLL
ncbi:dimethylaniline monooxygenase [N-oxide-forming] 5-like [Dendronephthya gigantea]|uniref:dimethylaniline monooxygenase [N-oxide-forming] 5-like n=1 Tax=Dendronephthya gigantea TaxID=151771 RepID=UPI00106D003A|nr:dimethylaniline monooxygenase [N-oxide-forming] 5-like [Dendronephthya gigantea]